MTHGMQPMPAYINQQTRWSELALTTHGGNHLIKSPRACKDNQRDDEYHIPIVDPGLIWRNLE
jgi:hypothetical protein